jgi:SOS-response transcriptional repressor LexA
MRIPFTEFMNKACRITGCRTQMELAGILGINRSAVTQAKKRDAVPEKWLLVLARRFALAPDWFENGRHEKPDSDPGLVRIPKVSAVLCAGAGSLEVEAAILGHIALPFSLTRSFGSPGHLVFMDIAGDSMEPGLRSGDTVLIDQSVRTVIPGSIMAVGHEENIYVKRLEMHPNGSVTLLSDNPAYHPIRLAGDELCSFRILGKLVRLFRKLS